jgi:pyridoxamine 5'-phosphate oxidase
MIDPIRRFGGLLERALRTELQEPTAMALATADARGRPSVRMVLLKDFDDGGFTFYTNLESRKALELDENPWGALCFHWPPLEVQVTIEGPVTRVPDEQADAYFASRPRGSQIGAWASLQSRPLASFSDLEERVLEIQARYEGGPVPRPPYWSGYRLVPERIEFWSGRASRLHERERYERDSDTGEWRVGLLYP